jgi:hypothetical protein
MAMLKSLDLTETVSYLVAGEDARSIHATVDRGGAEPIMQGQAPGIQIAVLNDASVGIDAATLDVGTDRIEVAERIGGTAKARGIQRIISQDVDFLTLAVL